MWMSRKSATCDYSRIGLVDACQWKLEGSIGYFVVVVVKVGRTTEEVAGEPSSSCGPRWREPGESGSERSICIDEI
jgi:hypothetical protein